MKRMFEFVLAIILIVSVIPFASAEDGLDSWVCPVCGATNDYDFCPYDGTGRSESGNVIAGYTDSYGTNSLPYLSEAFPGIATKLRPLSDENNRRYSFTGPGNRYLSSGGYKPRKQKSVTAYFVEEDWVFVYMQYATAEDRYVYFKRSAIENTDEYIPEVSNLEYYNGETIDDVIPSWGPSSAFNLLVAYPVKAGTPIRAFFQENGYIYAEFTAEKALLRMWLPANKVDIPEASFETSDDPLRQNGRSLWGQQITTEQNSDTQNDDTSSDIIDMEEDEEDWSEENYSPESDTENTTEEEVTNESNDTESGEEPDGFDYDENDGAGDLP